MAERDRQRFFSSQQRTEYEDIKGEGCEWEVEKGVRCGRSVVESSHMQAWSQGGETTLENMGRQCRPHHAIQHAMDGDPQSARLIWERMSEDERKETTTIASIFGFRRN